jgi:hypothetical protein
MCANTGGGARLRIPECDRKTAPGDDRGARRGLLSVCPCHLVSIDSIQQRTGHASQSITSEADPASSRVGRFPSPLTIQPTRALAEAHSRERSQSMSIPILRHTRYVAGEFTRDAPVAETGSFD